ncbi:MAG: UDP-N-acetylmuramate dehydrogenase [Clostridia bacterium]|nr:UDP-N-acetylmuramate dehydrogenase [Clostridia bacterium]
MTETVCERIFAALSDLPELKIERNLQLADYTTFRIGGPAALAIFPQSCDAARAALDLLHNESVPYAIMGKGSNLLCADAGFDGAVLFTGAMQKISFSGNRVTADCGVSLTGLAVETQRRGLAGLAFAYGIPGSVGGAVKMNAGAYGGEMSEVVVCSLFYDAATARFAKITEEEHHFGYRRSIYAEVPGSIALSVEMELIPGDPLAIEAEMRDYMQRRRSKQPLELPSAGSVFKRPEGYFAGKLIEDCGLKGTQIGGARVSDKHAGFIVNVGGATADDVLRLIDLIRERVLWEFGVTLECELCRLG